MDKFLTFLIVGCYFLVGNQLADLVHGQRDYFFIRIYFAQHPTSTLAGFVKGPSYPRRCSFFWGVRVCSTAHQGRSHVRN